jgi:pimeloyl-ACP methyl ester carboxylesterase
VPTGSCGTLGWRVPVDDHNAIRRAAYRGRDGARLSYAEIGEGMPLLLLHGYLGTAGSAWADSGHAAALARRGCRVVMPDLRGHGASTDAGAYPPDALVDDVAALTAHLGLERYDLVGYSLGARVAARAVARGARPDRLALAGVGLEEIVDAEGRGAGFRHLLENLGNFPPGSREREAEDFLRRVGADPAALLRVLGTFVNTPAAQLARITVPTLVLCGSADPRLPEAERLADCIPAARLRSLPGDHVSAAASPELVLSLDDFLADELVA